MQPVSPLTDFSFDFQDLALKRVDANAAFTDRQSRQPEADQSEHRRLGHSGGQFGNRSEGVLQSRSP